MIASPSVRDKRGYTIYLFMFFLLNIVSWKKYSFTTQIANFSVNINTVNSVVTFSMCSIRAKFFSFTTGICTFRFDWFGIDLGFYLYASLSGIRIRRWYWKTIRV